MVRRALLAAVALLVPVTGAAHADTGLGTSRECNFHSAPPAGCAVVLKGYKGRKLYIQALHYDALSVNAKVYRNGRFVKTLVNADDASQWIPYRNGRYVVKLRFETGEGVNTVVKRFRITDS